MVTPNLGIDVRITTKWFFRKWDGKTRTGLIWLRIGTDGGYLQRRQWTIGFHKMRGISWLSEDLLALRKDSKKCGEFLDYLRTC
jgi:hypothetical protein